MIHYDIYYDTHVTVLLIVAAKCHPPHTLLYNTRACLFGMGGASEVRVRIPWF